MISQPKNGIGMGYMNLHQVTQNKNKRALVKIANPEAILVS